MERLGIYGRELRLATALTAIPLKHFQVLAANHFHQLEKHCRSLVKPT